ncbi:hypothetical protein DEO72_LG6g1176 [Vigna unguiculata]|uniref:Uncharacterized protein n=1 Tax=Vigna unguiculata TaxID=3917 RepID=A0A4D6M5A5_VIGUN|nr:hypothetical protein DEO72_LG6g1176 [Vigna unguiculata]
MSAAVAVALPPSVTSSATVSSSSPRTITICGTTENSIVRSSSAMDAHPSRTCACSKHPTTVSHALRR